MPEHLEKHTDVVTDVVTEVVEERSGVGEEVVLTRPSSSPPARHPFLVQNLPLFPLTPELVAARREALREIRKELQGIEALDIRGRKYYGFEQLAPLVPLVFQHYVVELEMSETVRGILVAKAHFRGITLGPGYADEWAWVSERDPIVQETKIANGDWLKVMANKASTQAIVRALKHALGISVRTVEEFVGGTDEGLNRQVLLVEELRTLLRQIGRTERRVLDSLNRSLKANYRHLYELPEKILRQLIAKAQAKIEEHEQALAVETIEGLSEELEPKPEQAPEQESEQKMEEREEAL